MSNLYKAVIFDLDGTLLDTLEDLADSVNEMLAMKGYEKRSLEEIRKFVGNGMAKLVMRSLPQNVSEQEYKECYEFFRASYNKNMKNKTHPYEGIINCLETLKKAGIKTVITSNKNDDAVKQLCKDFFGDLIVDSYGVKDGVLPKPDPQMVLNAISDLSLTKDECIFVGDSDTDILTAKNAGLVSAGVLWGFRDRNVLEKSGADYIIAQPQELMQLILLKYR